MKCEPYFEILGFLPPSEEPKEHQDCLRLDIRFTCPTVIETPERLGPQGMSFPKGFCLFVKAYLFMAAEGGGGLLGRERRRENPSRLSAHKPDVGLDPTN